MDVTYRNILNREVVPKLIELGFKEIRLQHCMRPEVLFRKSNLWFGTSWDFRDEYLELNIGGLYWLKDLMPRVVVLGEYSAHCALGKPTTSVRAGDLEQIAETVAFSIRNVVAQSPDTLQQSEAKQVARLRPLIVGKVLDSDLEAYEA